MLNDEIVESIGQAGSKQAESDNKTNQCSRILVDSSYPLKIGDRQQQC